MSTAVLTSKGQVTIPLEVRKKLGLDQGDRVDFVDLGNNQFGIMAAVEDVSSLKGLVRKPAKPVSVAAMNETIAKRGAKR
ncbi:MAG: AbrB/MazE/SpoVT family DNA-binding domain-containing protein [Sideroxyarcus sp.]|jgi:antitoxin PrlF